MHLPRRALWGFDRHVLSRPLGMNPKAGRVAMEALATALLPPRGVEIRKTGPDSRSRLLVPEGADEAPRIVWAHGGAYALNSPRVYSAFVAGVAKAIGVSVLLPAYRRAPEHPYPAALEDVVAAYRTVARERPAIMAGDSAGGGLALGTAITLRDAGEPLPAGLLLVSPWVDLTLSGESITANDGLDANLRAKDLPRHVQGYAAGMDPGDPRISPLNADLSGLPRALIQCGGDELFLSEDTGLASRLRSAGSPVELQVAEGMWHVFQAHVGMLEEADAAVERMAAWARPLLD
jgi:epsilon-lactone hydrolase